MVDFVVRPTFDNHADLVFTRVGAVTSDSAKIVVRYPGVEDGVRIVWKQVDATATIPSSDEVGWIDGPIVELNPHQDWVGHAKLMNLWTGTKYECWFLLPLRDWYWRGTDNRSLQTVSPLPIPHFFRTPQHLSPSKHSPTLAYLALNSNLSPAAVSYVLYISFSHSVPFPRV